MKFISKYSICLVLIFIIVLCSLSNTYAFEISSDGSQIKFGNEELSGYTDEKLKTIYYLLYSKDSDLKIAGKDGYITAIQGFSGKDKTYNNLDKFKSVVSKYDNGVSIFTYPDLNTKDYTTLIKLLKSMNGDSSIIPSGVSDDVKKSSCIQAILNRQSSSDYNMSGLSFDSGSGSSDKTEEETAKIKVNSGLKSESNFGVDGSYKDNIVDLPDEDTLSVEQKSELKTWKDNIKDSSNKPIKVLRAFIAFSGIIFTIYAIFIYLAYWFDRINNFIDLALLPVLTFGRLCISPDDKTSTYASKQEGIKVVVHKDIIIACISCFSIGIMLLTGKIYTIVYYVIFYLREIGGTLF